MANTEYIKEDLKKKLKSEHGDKLRSLLLPKDDLGNDYLEVLAVVPSRSTTGQFLRFVNTDPKKAQEILVKNSLLTNKEEVLADDGLFSAAFGLVAELIPMRQGKFGKV
ncbi:hypothetical protein [Riemerella anatipestifer]|uniref:Uncharacterized protein n=1 Tax=Riemerella anatipestifer TaxID=34085 RepID=A0A1S7DV48_RIEAN|nr:hypothetical protein [Riemerella anatipestifer]AQY22977.1 hypothetical protein AB406_2037 [Riemerella anatipestifer]MBT0556845.1 hypothetical protein [Riemerella anatipestifer]MCO7355768.1 hypothetical protein [Riemerella anatipestifer]MDY3351866.1 hypothetical protein [Riemerella anatipestifer]MDY3525049.1 hypothetical protein [Riemerella anatipestifer]